ncbi:MAG: hypothetical protein ABSH50_16270 [Bryobacteraceae bacterium]|jgi:hypothetical protein
MRLAIMIVALAASACYGQTTKVFQFTQNQNPQDLQEISVVLRATADIQQQSIDDKTRSITVNAPEEQVAMANWLVRQLDLPRAATSGGVREYRPPTGGDVVVRVLYAKHAPAPQDLQELVTTIRSVADVQRVFVYNALNAVVVRGTNQHISLAAWLMDELDQPADAPAPAPQEYKLPGDDVARVFDLANPQTPEQLQEIVTLIRSVGDIQRLFVCVRRRSIALRATTERVALATWLVNELDRPASAATAGAGTHEFQTGERSGECGPGILSGEI